MNDSNVILQFVHCRETLFAVLTDFAVIFPGHMNIIMAVRKSTLFRSDIFVAPRTNVPPVRRFYNVIVQVFAMFKVAVGDIVAKSALIFTFNVIR